MQAIACSVQNERAFVRSKIAPSKAKTLADGELSDAEDNTLFEAMDLMGLVVPSDLSGAQVLMDELSKGLMLGSA
ncbi:MAG: hypothetical protein AAFY20_15495 [Cyanobacteria bacterium J06639_14]